MDDLAGVIVIIDPAPQESPELVESMPVGLKCRLPTEVPLTDEPGVISRGLEQRGQGGWRRSQAAQHIGFATSAQRIFDTDALLISAGDEADTCGRAIRAVGVKIGHLHAFPRETIDVRSLCVRHTVAA